MEYYSEGVNIFQFSRRGDGRPFASCFTAVDATHMTAALNFYEQTKGDVVLGAGADVIDAIRCYNLDRERPSVEEDTPGTLIWRPTQTKAGE